MITIESNSPSEATVKFVYIAPTKEVIDLLVEHGLDDAGMVVEGTTEIEPEVVALAATPDRLRPLLERRITTLLQEIGPSIYRRQVAQQAEMADAAVEAEEEDDVDEC